MNRDSGAGSNWPRAALVIALLAACAARCGSTSTSVTAPSGAKCAVTVSNSLSTVPASGAAGTVTVSTSRDCTWAASSSNNWIAITSASSGQGEGTVDYRVAANMDHASRRGTLAVNDQQVTIAGSGRLSGLRSTRSVQALQRPAERSPCASRQMRRAGRPPRRTRTGSAWSHRGSGSGSGQSLTQHRPELRRARTATVTIAGQTFTVARPRQPDCTAQLAPASQNFGAPGGTGAVAVSIGTRCNWNATSSADWVTVTSRSSGTGPRRSPSTWRRMPQPPAGVRQ